MRNNHPLKKTVSSVCNQSACSLLLTYIWSWAEQSLPENKNIPTLVNGKFFCTYFPKEKLYSVEYFFFFLKHLYLLLIKCFSIMQQARSPAFHNHMQQGVQAIYCRRQPNFLLHFSTKVFFHYYFK